MKSFSTGLALALALVAAACGEVSRNSDAGSGDHRDGGDVIIADAAAPDAAAVACDGPEDCTDPDDPCLLPGPCEGNVCHFGAIECGDLDGECTVGICRDGDCVAKAVREAQPCGPGLMVCGAYQGCGGFADTCDQSGADPRSCTDSTCQAGTCATGAPYTDSRNCSRNTTGTVCSDQELACQNCSYSLTCDRSDPVDCVQTDYACASEVCTPSQTSFTDNNLCDRDTEGQPCNGDGCCSVSGTCVASCQ